MAADGTKEARVGDNLISVIVVMGVAGSGKSTIGPMLARRLDCEFADADAFHPPANVEKMKSGVPLTDEDRTPWLQAIAAWIDRKRAAGQRGVVGCSALKRAYRRVLRGDRSDVRFVYLKGDRALIAARMAARTGHFMPVGLLDSQFRTLEEPGPDENPLVVSIEAPPREIVEAVLLEMERASSPQMR
jgi:carbohydrate kinase (thermoresistant glucokinase family)